jgi:hypothetical protein
MVLYNSFIYCMLLIREQRMGNGTCHLIKGARQHQHAKFNSIKIAKLVTCGHIYNVGLCSSTFFHLPAHYNTGQLTILLSLLLQAIPMAPWATAGSISSMDNIDVTFSTIFSRFSPASANSVAWTSPFLSFVNRV